MASLFDIGKSGVQAYRQALTVTGQNITNINKIGRAHVRTPVTRGSRMPSSA